MQHDGKGFVFEGVGGGDPFVTLREGKNVVFAKPENNAWVTRQLR
jgi:hypothetical protein